MKYLIKSLINFENSNSRERRQKKASALRNHYTVLHGFVFVLYFVCSHTWCGFHSLLERVGEGRGGSFKSGRPMSRGKILDVDG